MRRTRSIALLVASAALAASVVAIERGLDTLGMAVAFKAKMLCSGVFVAGRQSAAVLGELELDDLAPLRYIHTAIDPGAGTASASMLGFVRRTAAFRGGTGCALASRGKPVATSSSPDLPPVHELPVPPAAPGDPILAGLDSVIGAAFAEPDSVHRRRTQAIVVMQHGRIVAERYAPGITRETRLLGWSMTKSVMNALVGTLVRDGRLSLDAPVALPAWRMPGDRRGAITMRHLLQMSSGLRLNEVMTSLRSDVIRMLLANDDMAAYAAARPLVADPGARWAYASGTTLIISRVIRDALGDDATYLRFPRQALFDRLGMPSALIETDASGTFVGSSLMYATARDWARFGQLYLNDGVWNDERILPEGWVDFTRTPAPADSQRSYGAHFWLGVPGDPGRPVSPLTRGALQAAGHEGQYLTIAPSHDAVIVRLGRTRYPDAWDQAAFVRDVLASLPRRTR